MTVPRITASRRAGSGCARFTAALALPLMLATCTGAPHERAGRVPAIPPWSRPEAAPRGQVVETLHATAVADPYRWLESTDAAGTRRFVRAWNEAARSWLADLPERAALRDRVRRLGDRERFGVPVRRGPRTFYAYDDGLESRDLWMATEALGARGQVFLDPHAAPLDGNPIAAIWPDPRGEQVAYALTRPGARAHALRVRDVRSGEDLPEVLEGVAAGVAPAWTASGRGFYYSRHTPLPEASASRSTQVAVWYHRLGSEQAGDALVYRPVSPLDDASPFLPGGRRFLVVKLSGDQGDAILALDLVAEGSRWRDILPSQAGRHDLVGSDGRLLFLRTTVGAPRGRVVAVDPRAPSAAVEILPDREVALTAVVLAGARWVAMYAADGRTSVRLHELDGTPVMDVELPASGSVAELTAAPEAAEAYYRLTPLGGATTVYRLDTTTGASRPLWSSRDTSAAAESVTERARLASDDGAWVTLSLVSRAQVRRTGDNPVLLTPRLASATADPGERTLRMSWIEGGGVLAVADVRDAGSSRERLAGRNGTEAAIADLVSAAEWLVASGITRTHRLAVEGSGAGGLLAAAAATRRPDLFAAALPDSGPYDLLRYRHGATVPGSWLAAYGSVDDVATFAILHRVSPVHAAATAACYPATLLTAAPDDTAPAWHAYKLAAALVHAQTCDAPVLLRVPTDTADDAAEGIEKVVDRLAFAYAVLGIAAGEPIP